MINIVCKPQVKCNDCGCFYDFQKEDIKEEKIYEGFDGYCLVRYVECPVCGRRFVISKKRHE